MPFFFFGGAAMAAGLYLLLSHTSLLSSRLPISGLLIAIGFMALAGGTFAAMIEDEGEVPTGAVQAAAATQVPGPKSDAPVAPSGALAGSPRTPGGTRKATELGSAGRVAAPRPVVRRPIWEEDWDVDSEGFRAAAAPPSPSDVVLRQIDELERLIRKKASRSPSD